MAVNLNKPDLWKADISQSVDMYNNWFMNFAPKAFRETRVQTTIDVEATLKTTDNLKNIESNPKFGFVQDSVRNSDVMHTLVEQCDVVYHLAAAVGVQLIVDDPVHTIETNIHQF